MTYTRRKSVFLTTTAMTILVGVSAYAEPSQIDSAIQLSKSTDWHDREAASDKLMAMRADPNARLALISLLRRETQHPEPATDADEEEAAGYYEDLVLSVARLNDPRALSVLTMPTVLCSGNAVAQGIGSLGHPAVEVVQRRLEKVSGGDSCERDSLLIVARNLLLGPLSEDDKGALVNLCIAAAQDPDPLVRIAAARALLASKGPSAENILQQLAATDPYVVHSNGRTIYPVREAALGRMDAPMSMPERVHLK